MAEKIEYIFPKEDGVALVDGLPRIVDHEAWDKRMEEFKRDRQFYGAHKNEFLEKYPYHWVAIYREEVVAVDQDRRAVGRKLDEMGIHKTHVVMHFMDSDPPTRIPSVLKSRP